jgi:LuxR family transcriptional regulator, maltose regulon positive regulatory protein
VRGLKTCHCQASRRQVLRFICGEYVTSTCRDPGPRRYRICVRGHLREVFAGPRSAQNELQATTAALKPPLDGSVPRVHRIWVAAAFLLGVISRDALGDPDAVGSALERAFDIAEADDVLLPLLAFPASGRPERQDGYPAAPAASFSKVIDLLARANGPVAPPGEPALPCEAPTRSEVRVLRYLPTNLSTSTLPATSEGLQRVR